MGLPDLAAKAAIELRIGSSAGKAVQSAAQRGLEEVLESNGIVQRALNLVNDGQVSQQLTNMQSSALKLKTGNIQNINPKFEIHEPAPVEILGLDGTKAQGFLHVLGVADRSSTLPLLAKTAPSQLISANLFQTAPASALREISFVPGMFADPTMLARTAEQWSAPWYASLRPTKLGQTVQGIWEGRPMHVMVSDFAGHKVANTFSGGWPEVFKKAQSSPRLSASLERAVVEREVIGDIDANAGNIVIAQIKGSPAIRNIDLEYAFQAGTQPELRMAFANKDLLGKPLTSATVSRVGQFVDNYGTHAGRSILEDSGMQAKQIDGVLSRAQWFVDRNTLPTTARIGWPNSATFSHVENSANWRPYGSSSFMR